MRCPNCKIPLVLHKEKNLARCNYCDYKIDQYSICEKCGSSNINTFGFGLEKVKEVITQYFPNKTILQVDSDILTKTDDYEKAIIDIEDGNVDIIIGTNILNKRINNYNIGLVCILSADRLLNSNDYRANEYTYNNIAKLINYDNLIIQTYYPNNEIIKYASTGDFDSYYEKEIERRKELQYFPFFEVNRITIQGEYKEKYHFANYFKKVYSRVVQGSVLGPVYDSKIKGIKLLLKHNDYEKVIKVYDDTKQAFREQKLLVSFERKPKVI